ncbi:UNVERIFIED_CONTAM: hypothetical protein K2H54_035785 [Gekko kuhli]
MVMAEIKIEIQPFIDFAVNNSCLTWRRQYESEGVNETYRVTMRVLGNEFKKTANELKINLTTIEEAVKICLPFHPNTNYSIKIEAESSNLVSRFSLINPVAGKVSTSMSSDLEKEVVFGNISVFNVNCIKWQRKSKIPYEQIYVVIGEREIVVYDVYVHPIFASQTMSQKPVDQMR